MIRVVLTAGAVVLSLSAAFAQQDPIKERKALMRANDDQASIGVDMLKGVKPFDMGTAHKIFATFENAAATMPNLFPDNSQDEKNPADADKFMASPKVWENTADLKARFAKFGEDAKAAEANVKDLDTFKASFLTIGKDDCGGCHQLYRLRTK